MSKKELKAQDQSTELATLDFMADVGQGMEGADKESFAIPFLKVLQKISPQVDEGDAAYIEGAKGGQFFNTVTQELFDGKEGLIFLHCAYQRRFLRWAARGTDGGFKGEYLPEDVAAMRHSGEIVEYEGRLYAPLEDGSVNPKRCDIFQDTRSHFGLVVNVETGQYQQVLMALSSTQIKKSKLIMSLLSSAKVQTAKGAVTPPTWMTKLHLTSVIESNDQGSWYGVKVAGAGFIASQDIYTAAKEFHELVSAGEANVNYAETHDEPSDSDDGAF